MERSFTGEIDPFVAPDPVPPSSVSEPVRDATVTVRNMDLTGDPCGRDVAFVENPAQPGIPLAAGVYWAPPGCPGMQPGQRLALRVETPAGEIVTGTTVIPGLDSAMVAVNAGPIRRFDDDTLGFNRDRDTLHLNAGVVAQRAVQIEVRRLSQPRDRTLRVLVDSTTATIPGDLLNVFLRGDGEETFLGGRFYVLIASAVDTNLFDFVRSANNAVTGRGLINRLDGGIGVFGAAAAASQTLEVAARQNEPREGTYRMTGVVRDSVIDLVWDVYLARATDSTAFSAFVRGRWLHGGYDRSVDGTFDGLRVRAELLDTVVLGPLSSRVATNAVRGAWRTDAPFTLDVLGEPPSEQPIGTVTVAKQ